MANPETTASTTRQAAGGINLNAESRVLLGFLQDQRDAVLRIVEGLPADAWQTPAVPSGWTVAGVLGTFAGSNTTGSSAWSRASRRTPPADKDAEEGEEYDPEAAFTCDLPSADLIASYRDACGRSDAVLADHPPVGGTARPRFSSRPGVHQADHQRPLDRLARDRGDSRALRPPGHRTRTA